MKKSILILFVIMILSSCATAKAEDYGFIKVCSSNYAPIYLQKANLMVEVINYIRPETVRYYNTFELQGKCIIFPDDRKYTIRRINATGLYSKETAVEFFIDDYCTIVAKEFRD